jgi:hypothetical protein
MTHALPYQRCVQSHEECQDQSVYISSYNSCQIKRTSLACDRVMYVSSLRYVNSLLFASLYYFLITRLIFFNIIFMFFFVLYFCFLFCEFYDFVLFLYCFVYCFSPNIYCLFSICVQFYQQLPRVLKHNCSK